jgi:glucose/mannose transport system permease protein
MSAPSQDVATRNGIFARAIIYSVLIVFAVYYLLPLYVMLVNSLKPLDEIRQGNMLALPSQWTIEPWLSAWSTAQIGVSPTGLKPYFLNSILMVVPAVALSTMLGALNGYVLTKWRFKGDNIIFGLMLLACFIPFQIVLIPSARILGLLGLAGTVPGLILIHASMASASPRCSSATTTRPSRPSWSARRRSTAPPSSRYSAASFCRRRDRSSS